MSQLNPSLYRRLTTPLDYGSSDGLYWDVANSQLVLAIAGTIVLKLAASPTSGKIPIADGTDVELTALAGDVTVNSSGTTAIGTGKVTNAMQAKPRLRVVTETVTRASMTDGGAAVGTKVLTASIPAGARYVATLSSALTGFAGDTSAVITVGDGTDVDRYNTGTPDMFTTAAAGVDMGAPSGTAFHSAAKSVTVTITSAADFTNVSAGSVDLTLIYYEPI